MFHHNIARGTAVLIVYLPFLIVALALLIFMVPRLVRDMRALGAQLPVLLEKNVLRQDVSRAGTLTRRRAPGVRRVND